MIPGAVETAMAIVFWCCVLGVAYAYAMYPAVIYVLSRAFGREAGPPADGVLPRVTLIIAAYNEGPILERRIADALALDYPGLDIVIASDGSDDDTARVCAKHVGRVRALLFPARRGKSATLNDAIARCDAEIVVLSDANTAMRTDSIRKLVRWFADPAVGAVCGRLILRDAASGGNADGVYWRYETFLKRCEGRLGGLLGANGAIYAIRREHFSPLPAGTIVDDFVIPLAAKLRTGCRIVYEPDAIAEEETAPDIQSEFGRRARIGVGGWQSLGTLWPLLSPRHGWTAFTLWSHKVLRWSCPFFMIGALMSSVVLAGHAVFAAALVAQIAFYAVATGAAVMPPAHRVLRRLRLCSMFVAMNAALLLGFVRWLRAPQSGIWRRTARTPS